MADALASTQIAARVEALERAQGEHGAWRGEVEAIRAELAATSATLATLSLQLEAMALEEAETEPLTPEPSLSSPSESPPLAEDAEGPEASPAPARRRRVI
jgi:hypothetical protein